MADWDAYYRTRFQPHPGRSVVWRCISEWLQPEVPRAGTVVEFGAGYCDFINNIAAKRKIALDVSATVQRMAGPDVEAHVCSCTNCSFIENAVVDIVFASNLFEHLTVSDVSLALHEAWRILKPTGKLIIVQPNFRYCYRDYFDDYTHISVFTDRSLGDLVASTGFRILRLEPRFVPFSMKNTFLAPAWAIRMYLRSPFRPKAGQMLLIARKES